MLPFDYQIIKRPRRKTVSISVQPDCSVRILVPAKLPKQTIVELIKQKSRWIQSKITIFQEIYHNHPPKEYINGDSFTYLGKNYRLKINQNTACESVKLKNGKFHVFCPPSLSEEIQKAYIKNQLKEWYWKHAEIRLKDKTTRLAKSIDLHPASIGIKDYKSRWGCCHPNRRIYYNWRLIMAPQSIIDYVVIHELCHLLHPNHSKQFWHLVGSILPDFVERRDWLKVNGFGLKL